MTVTDDNAPATRGDLRTLEKKMNQTMGEQFQWFARSIMDAMQDMEKRMIKHMDEKDAASENRMMTLMEQWKHDLVGIHKDKISQHEDRITRLEIHTGLAV